jgi:hypothetical protein
MSVELRITDGPEKGKTFAFPDHDTFLFGRLEDCHARLPNDQQVSRRHFILEACPPKVSLRDLGSLNGTYVNGKKWGGRNKGESPEQGAKHRFPTVDLKHGDQISVGQTRIEIIVREDQGPKIKAEVQAGELSELSPEKLYDLIFGQEQKVPLLQIPGYRIEKELGRGGFGAVYQAVREKDRKTVAIKIMLSQTDASERDIERFKREMEVGLQLEHPNIVRFLESGSNKGCFYFTMELCDGGSLQDMFRKNRAPLPLTTVMPLILQALEGLAHAHEQGFVHRDLKPGNILIHQGSARISDFGLSKNFQLAGLSGLSVTGGHSGTPVFMPPEQIINFKYVKPVSDVFSMGATIYHLLTGEFPFDFSAKRDPMDVILNDEVIPIQKRISSLPKGLVATIDRSVRKSHKDRFQNAAEMLKAIK